MLEIKLELIRRCWVIKQKIKAYKQSLFPATEPEPVRLDIKKLCEYCNHPEYYIQILNRMLKQIDQDLEYMRGLSVPLDAKNYNILIDKTAFTKWYDLLSDYFDNEEMIRIAIDFVVLEKEKQSDFKVQTMLQDISTKELKEMLLPHYETDEEFLQAIENRPEYYDEYRLALVKELERRKHIKYWFQWVYRKLSGCQGVYQ